jgi:hypothetical protein
VKLKSSVVLIMFALASYFPRVSLAGGLWHDLGGGWKFRVDRPHTGPDTSKYHVHVNNGNDEVGSECVDGSASHGDNMNNVPKSIKEKIKSHPEYAKGQKKQADLEKAKAEIKDKRLDMDNTADVVIAIGIVIACTATAFFPADDIVAWANFLRVIGA